MKNSFETLCAKTDFFALAMQKRDLVKLLSAPGLAQEDVNSIDGVISFLDAFQDCVVEQELVPEMYVFPEQDVVGIVCWPQSQELMEVAGFEEHCQLINDDYGLEKYGSSAYFVDAGFGAEVRS